MEITKEWIAEQRQISEIVDMVCEDASGSVVPLLKQIEKSQTAALDALEAAYAKIARLVSENADCVQGVKECGISAAKEIARLIAERDAEKKLADALDPAIEDMKQALCCGGFRELSAACSELWRIWDQNAPTGAESEADHA